MDTLTENIEKILHTPPVIAHPTTSLSEIISILKDKGINHLPIVDKDKVVGVISKQDLFKKILSLSHTTTGRTYNQIQLDHMQAMEVMTPDPITVLPSDSIRYAEELLLQGEFHCLPVVDNNNKPLGMVTPYDILKYYNR
jgi:acetoin utilization protein AcuB